MNYKEILNNVYTEFKSNNQYISNTDVKFYRENNTNIVNFEVNDKNAGIMNGTIIEQSNNVLMYFYIKGELGDYIILSRANVDIERIATITNALIIDGQFEQIETIRRNFNERRELYKPNVGDQIINDFELDSGFTSLAFNIIEQYSKKNKQKGHKI